MVIFTYGSTFSRINWSSHVCVLPHWRFLVWIWFLTQGLALSRMLSHGWSFLRMSLLCHAWIGSLTYAFSRMGLFMGVSTWAFSRMGLLCHAWIGCLTYAFWRMGVSTYGSIWSRMDWLSHVCFLRMGPLFHAWIGSLTYASSRMGLFTYWSTFSRMDWLSHVCFLTHGLFVVWVYFVTHGLALSRMLSHAWACSRIGLLFHAWIGSLAYAFSRMGLFTYGNIFTHGLT